MRPEQFRVRTVLRVARVTAINDEITWLKNLCQHRDGVMGDRSGRNHHPHDPWRTEQTRKFGQIRDIGHLGARVVADHLVTTVAEPLTHVEAHLAQPHQTKLHLDAPS